MQEFIKNIRGDRSIWAVVALLALFSFMPVYSASSNLAYLYGDGNTLQFLVKHLAHLSLGFVILFGVHRIPYHYFKGLSMIALPIMMILLVLTLAQGTTIEGANAARWIKLPVVGVTFQTSALAAVVLLVYVARYLARIKDEQITFKQTLWPLWTPVFIVIGLILPANLSTALLIFAMVLMLVFVGGHPIKYIASVLGIGMLSLTLFILAAKAFPGMFPNRVDTWTSRIESFMTKEVDKKEKDYQITQANIAIATGGMLGLGPGKSIQKNFLPQSSSDFIYAIIIEEFGLVGGLLLLIFYLLLLFRLVVLVYKTKDYFGRLLVIGVGVPLLFQAFINMGVAVSLFPVTGQTLPLISSGGTSIWTTCVALGVILSVSAHRKDKIEVKEESSNPLDILSETI
jgi:cell division protein FtsW